MTDAQCAAQASRGTPLTSHSALQLAQELADLVRVRGRGRGRVRVRVRVRVRARARVRVRVRVRVEEVRIKVRGPCAASARSRRAAWPRR